MWARWDISLCPSPQSYWHQYCFRFLGSYICFVKGLKILPVKCNCQFQVYLRSNTRFPTMWYVRPAEPQVCLSIFAVWSEPFLAAWSHTATDWTWFGVSELERRLHRLIWVYICQNATLLEITCLGSFWNWLCDIRTKPLKSDAQVKNNKARIFNDSAHKRL